MTRSRRADAIAAVQRARQERYSNPKRATSSRACSPRIARRSTRRSSTTAILIKSQPKGKPENQEWRTEYRKALLWDEKNTKEAISEYRRYAAEKPGDFEVHRTLAKLLARDDPRSAGGRLAVQRPREGAARRPRAPARVRARPVRRPAAAHRGDQEYRTLVEKEPTPELREALADLLAARPDGRDEAREQYEAILREKPD